MLTLAAAAALAITIDTLPPLSQEGGVKQVRIATTAPRRKVSPLLKTAAPYALAYSADWLTSERYMRTFRCGWECHEANPLAKTVGARAAIGVGGVVASTLFDRELQRRGHRSWAKAFRWTWVGARLLVSIRTLAITEPLQTRKVR